jgi:hypothetical protein
MKEDIKERERDKFRPASGGQSKVAVTVEQDSPIPVDLAENIAQQILKAPDRNKAFSWADFGSKNERVTSVVYTAPSVGAYTLTKTFNYTQVGSNYRLDTEGLVLS